MILLDVLEPSSNIAYNYSLCFKFDEETVHVSVCSQIHAVYVHARSELPCAYITALHMSFKWLHHTRPSISKTYHFPVLWISLLQTKDTRIEDCRPKKQRVSELCSAVRFASLPRLSAAQKRCVRSSLSLLLFFIHNT
jgi:hypothetical protein